MMQLSGLRECDAMRPNRMRAAYRGEYGKMPKFAFTGRCFAYTGNIWTLSHAKVNFPLNIHNFLIQWRMGRKYTLVNYIYEMGEREGCTAVHWVDVVIYGYWVPIRVNQFVLTSDRWHIDLFAVWYFMIQFVDCSVKLDWNGHWFWSVQTEFHRRCQPVLWRCPANGLSRILIKRN